MALSISAGAVGFDDAQLWTYFNNVAEPLPLFWRMGYVPVIPALFGYAARWLPAVWQLAAYQAFAALVAVLLWRELETLFGSTRDASLLAGAVIAGLFVVDTTLFASLAWIQWSALLAAMVRLGRATRAASHIGWCPLFAVAVGLLTSPVGIVAIPLLVAHAMRVREQRTRVARLAALVVIAHAIQGWWYPSWDVPLQSSGAFLRDGLTGEWHEQVWTVLVSLAIVLALALEKIWRRAEARDAAWLLVVAVVATGTVVVSGRVVHEGFESRYVVVPWCCALVAIGLRALALPPPARRRAVAVFGVLMLLLAARELNQTRRGPIESTWQKYRFVAAAAEFRRRCTLNEVMVYEDEPSSLVVLCAPRPLRPGSYPLVNFVPAYGNYGEAVALEKRPAIIVFQPLLAPGRSAWRDPIDGGRRAVTPGHIGHE